MILFHAPDTEADDERFISKGYQRWRRRAFFFAQAKGRPEAVPLNLYWVENSRRPPRSWPPASLGLDARKACNQRLTLSSENEWCTPFTS